MIPVERIMPPLNADERMTLEAWLDFHRTTLVAKCAGLDDQQGATRSASPSEFTLIGLVQHVEIARAHCADRALTDTGRFQGQPVSLRWIYVHLIEEYARHNGHADLLRERIDGATGL